MSSMSVRDVDHQNDSSPVQPLTDGRIVSPELDPGDHRLPPRWSDDSPTGRLRVRTHPVPRVLEALRAHPLGAELILTKSLLFALYAVLRIPAPAVKGIRLRSQPNAPRAASAA